MDGSRFTDNSSYDVTPFLSEVLSRDKRLAQIIRTPGYKLLGVNTPPDFGHTKTGYHFIKYTQDDNPNLAMSKNTNSLPIFRYAEVLLNYAEAKAELGQMDNFIWDQTIAALRSRAGIINTSRPTIADPYMAQLFPETTSADILEIRRERGIELVGEGLRFDDLRRWRAGHLLTKVWDGMYIPQLNVLMDMNNDGVSDVCFVTAKPSNPQTGVFYYILSPSNSLSSGTNGKLQIYGNINKVFESKKYLYPIPESALLKNQNLGQNPGWI
ncbi:MAG: RagB/SusD family nutrient uptake outer membrane protein [Bacteroidales bacterium]